MASQPGRFFVLDEPVPSGEIESFMGRLVTCVTSPLLNYAPSNYPGVPHHNTNDIIPSILPTPSISTSNGEEATVFAKKGIFVKLSSIFNIEIGNNRGETRRLECRVAKRYRLPNPDQHFKQLMSNQHYAKDAQALLAQSSSKEAYFITGFLTATDATWTIEAAESKGADAALGVSPVGAAAGGVSVPGLPYVSFGANGSRGFGRSGQRHVAEEEIIAVSYSVVRNSSKLDYSSMSIRQSLFIGLPKRAKSHHLTMGPKDDQEEEFDWDSEDEDSDVKALGNVVGNEKRQDQEHIEISTKLIEGGEGDLYIIII